MCFGVMYSDACAVTLTWPFDCSNDESCNIHSNENLYIGKNYIGIEPSTQICKLQITPAPYFLIGKNEGISRLFCMG